MREAIDYNALSWIRQEVGVTLKQARLELEEYAEGERRKELLQGCAAHLHEARGPLQMVNIKGADMLACEMEEAIADLLLETVVDADTLLEQLMQGFLELSDYLSNLRSGKQDNPRLLFPLINSLRASRGLQPLKENAVFSPDLSARVPVSVFNEQADHGGHDVAALARTARVRFQSGLLEWYRDSGTNHGLQTLVEVLEHLQETAGSEPAARLWWVGAGVAELLRDGVLDAKPAIKQLFSQLDRQIRRLMDSGEGVFDDLISDDLVKNLLFQLVGVNTDSRRIATISSTFGIPLRDATRPDGGNEAIPEIGSELLQTVAVAARDDIERIKEQLDTITRSSDAGDDAITPVADGLHKLGNTLGMIGMEGLADRVAAEGQQLGNLVVADGTNFTNLANTLIAVDDALSDITAHAGNGEDGEEADTAVFRQGQQAVVNAVIADIATAKDAINEFLKSSGEFDLIEPVPVLLNKISGGLEMVGEERLAVAARQVRSFISTELLEKHRDLNDDQLDSLADAICSIEYCAEELSENHTFGERAIGVAIESLEKLGYTDAGLFAVAPETTAEKEPFDDGVSEAASEAVVVFTPEHQPAPALEESQHTEPSTIEAAAIKMSGIADLQVVAPDADNEIVEIFIEEAGEVLDTLAVHIPAWIAHPENHDTLAEIRRAFHTIKGSGRMVGAMAAGELAWAFENLLNKVIEGVVPVDSTVIELVGQSMPALKDLVAQVRNPDTILLTDVSAIGRQVADISQPEVVSRPEAPGFDGDIEQQALVAEDQASDVQASGLHDVSEAGMPELDTTTIAGPEEWVEAVTASVPEEFDAESEPAHASGESTAEHEGQVETGVMQGVAVSPAGQAEQLETEDVQAVTETSSGQDEPAETAGMVASEAEELLENAVHADAYAPVVTGVEDLPVLKQDADPEIVEIFLEEANEELASISLKIPEWIQQPDDNELLSDIRRSLHTLKGSGRMAGAMIMGEFSWSMETVLNKLVEGTLQAGGSLFGLFSQVPQAVSGLLRQLQDGTAPDADINGMMQKAADLVSDDQAEPAELQAANNQEVATSAVESDAGPVDEDDDTVLMELFSAECQEHLDTLSASAANTGVSCMVTDAHYRALHTLSGIGESASVHGIGRLAAALYDYFGEYYQEGRPAVPEAFTVLGDFILEMSSQLQRLPDQHYDEAVVSGLLGRLAELPVAATAAEQAPEQTQEMDATSAEVPPGEPATHEYDAFDEIPELPLVALSARDDRAESSEALLEGTGQEAADSADAETVDETVAAAPGIEVEATVPTQDKDELYSGMDQELFEIFVEEATEIIDSSESVLRSWSKAPNDHELMADFQRLLHTLKGGARMVDINAIGDLSHALESLITQVADGVVSSSDDMFALLQESHDRLAEMVEKVKLRKNIVAANDLEEQLGAFVRGDTGVSAMHNHVAFTEKGEQPESHSPEKASPDTSDGFGDKQDHDGGDIEGAPVAFGQALPESDARASDAGMMVQAMAGQTHNVERRKEGRPRSELVRVQSDILDNLVNNAGEINIYRARMEQQISNFRFNLTELDQTINRLRDQLRQLEMENEMQILFRYEQETESGNQDFDPLEMDRYSKLQQLSRSLIESISDLRSLQGLMELTTRDSETLLLQQSRVSTDLQEGLIRTRMIPFAGLAPRLRRIVRQSARQLEKKVDLHLHGADGEMDRAVIERIVAPLEHMLRNAVAHGIETPDRRKNAGKHVAGSITIDFSREGNEIVLRITDDGAGLDVDAIRSRAIERGLMSADIDLPDTDVMQFVLQTGFSTATEVTQISGRGVGMDVVNSEVKQLGGSLHIASEGGKGSVFTIRLPYTLAINRALLITAADQIFCVPMGSIEGVVTATTAQLKTCYEDGTEEFGYAGNTYQLMHLGTCLGLSSMDLESANIQIPILLVRTGDKRIGMQIDTLLGNREVVIKPLGAQLSMIDGISGATILGDGRVVMILDMFAISRMKAREQLPIRTASLQEDSRLLMMVVDDSITVRKVTSRLLERSGFRVMTAKDGVDAMGQLQEAVPDMMLLDIEMPRMDGFELATHMRNDERLKHVPIIMITSRTGDKHRDRAFEIGVNDYLGKPYQESELLESINNIIGVKTRAVGA